MCTEYANTEEQIEATNNINKTDRAGCESKKKVYLDEFIPFPTVISTKYIQAQSDPYNTPMTESDLGCDGINKTVLIAIDCVLYYLPAFTAVISCQSTFFSFFVY